MNLLGAKDEEIARSIFPYEDLTGEQCFKLVRIEPNQHLFSVLSATQIGRIYRYTMKEWNKPKHDGPFTAFANYDSTLKFYKTMSGRPLYSEYYAIAICDYELSEYRYLWVSLVGDHEEPKDMEELYANRQANINIMKRFPIGTILCKRLRPYAIVKNEYIGSTAQRMVLEHNIPTIYL